MIDLDVFHSIKGFMDETEALRLYQEALAASHTGHPVLEIGSYCGKSAYVIGMACGKNDSVLFSIDHHRGSEEQQKGQEFFDPHLYDPIHDRIDTFPFFQRTIEEHGLADVVIPVVAASSIAAKKWKTPLSMVFIDGGHSLEAVETDFLSWNRHIIPGGLLVMHDIFFDPSQGGQAPRQVYEKALATGAFFERKMTKTLGVLEKIQ